MKKNGFLVIPGLLGTCGLLVAATVFANVTGTLLPTAEGSYLKWTPKTGTTHFTMIDEAACNGTTDYNATTTIGSRDSYTVSLSSIANGSSITQIDIVPCASRNNNGGGSSTMNVFYRLNGVDSADAGSYALTGTTPTQLATTTFSGLSTIKGSGTTLQIGAVLSAGTKGVRLSRIATQVTYTLLSAPSNLTASATSSSEINLGWIDSSSIEDGFFIERASVATSSCGSFLQVATTSANAIGFNDTRLASSTKYCYRTRAFNSGGNSSYSNTASSTTF